MSNYVFRAPREVLDFMDEIADTMVALFGIARAEALDRINERWRDHEFSEEPLLFHETADFWARDTYYGPESYWWHNPPDLKPLPIRWSLRRGRLDRR